MLAEAMKADFFTLRITIFLDVGLRTLEDDAALFLVGL